MIHHQNNFEYEFELALLRQLTNNKTERVQPECRRSSKELFSRLLEHNQNRFTQILTRIHVVGAGQRYIGVRGKMQKFRPQSKFYKNRCSGS